MSRRWALLFLMVFAGCIVGDFPKPIPGTTYRIGEPVPAKDSELTVKVFTDANDCMNAKIDNLEECVPRVDRAHGEVRLAFDLRDPQSLDTVYRSMAKDQMSILHDKSRQDLWDLIPHDPIRAGQLFILVIDGSGSMYENDGEPIKKVYQALMTKQVIDGFYPKGNSSTGVVLLRFSKEVHGLDGGEPRVLRKRGAYENMIRNHLMQRSGGFTHLYDAAKYSVTDLLKHPAIQDFVMAKSAEPTIVLLTDGFNNEKGSDKCADNAPRLQEAVDVIKEARRGGGSLRPTVYAVGLGKRYQNKDKPDRLNRSVTPTALCGSFVNRTINGDLEKQGIDHISLDWLAETGGGLSFVKNKPKGLADVFQQAAAARFRWYEVRYKVPDNFYHRKSFTVQLNLRAFARAYTTITIHPSGWIDPPGGELEPGQKWSKARPLTESLALLMPVLGFLVFLNFLGPALFNARRAVFRRMKPRK